MGNDKGNLSGGGLPAPPGLPLSLNGHNHAHLNGDFANAFWKDIPALSWTMNLDDGQFQVRGTHPDSDVTSVPVDVLGRLLRTKVEDQGARPTQFLGVLPALDGTPRNFLIIGFPVGPANGTQQRHMAGTAVDVTQHKLRLDELALQALVDELTGLYNLRGFMLLAEHDLKVARRRRVLSAIVYVDVDGLKEINDTCGHSAGSALLASTAKLLRHVFRECDVIGRLGGDEFAVLASDVAGDPQNLVRRLRNEVQTVAPMRGGPAGLRVSIGVAACPHDKCMSLADMVAAADGAMYREKAERSRRAASALTAH